MLNQQSSPLSHTLARWPASKLSPLLCPPVAEPTTPFISHVLADRLRTVASRIMWAYANGVGHSARQSRHRAPWGDGRFAELRDLDFIKNLDEEPCRYFRKNIGVLMCVAVGTFTKEWSCHYVASKLPSSFSSVSCNSIQNELC